MAKYVFFDVDGTLWGNDMKMPKSTKEAIKQMQKNGHKAFVCTGRAMGNVRDPQFTEVGFDGYIASCGNHIEMNQNILYENNMPFEIVKKVYDVSRACKLPVIYEGTYCHWLDRKGFEGDNYIHYIIEYFRDMAVFLDECDIRDISANKFSALINPDTDYEGVKKELSSYFDFLEHGGGVIEAVPKGTSKATGIAWMCEHLGISSEDTYAIGDSVNDLEMLKFAGHGIAMGNGSQIVKDTAEYVTTSVSEDGIWNALEHYGLINLEK